MLNPTHYIAQNYRNKKNTPGVLKRGGVFSGNSTNP